MPSEIVKYSPTYTHDSSMSLSIRSGVEAFFRQRRLVSVVAALVIVATVALTLIMRRQYVSEMKFLVQNVRQNVVVTPERTNGNLEREVTETQVNSEIEILRSHDVMDQVADPDWEKLKPEQRDDAAKKIHEGRIAAFDKRLITEPVRKTNVISVTLRAGSAEEAHDALQKLSDAYLAQHRRMQRPAGASEFFAAEAERYRKAWDEASARQVEFQQKYQVNSLQQRETDVEDQLNKLEADALTSDATLHELDARLVEGSRRLKDLSARRTTQQTMMPRLQSIQQLSTLVVELENRRTTLLTNYKPEDRQVRELDKQLESTRAALNEAATVNSEQVTTDVDPLWQQIRTDLAQGNIARRATSAHHAAVSAQMDALKKQLGEMQSLNVQYNNLDAQVKEQQKNYELYAEKRDQSQIADAMDQRGLMNVVVAQEPTLSFSPARPKPLLNAMLGIVTALFLGFCAIYLAETGRNTLATPRELDAASRYPILATVAMADSRGYVTGPRGLDGRRDLASVIVHTTRPSDLSYQR